MGACNFPHPRCEGLINEITSSKLQETSTSSRKLDLIPHFRSMQETILSIPNSEKNLSY